MARQVCDIFSVKEHCHPNAFVAEVMLYDRLVIPLPARDDLAELRRWEKFGWQPKRLDKIAKKSPETGHI